MRQMKVLIVGSDSVFAIENFYMRYMKQQGVDVELYAAQQAFYAYYNKNIIKKILFRFGVSRIFKTINAAVLQKVTTFQPDIVWVFKGMEIFPETLQELKRSGVKLVNYNPDNPFIFTGKGSGNKNVSDSISLYDLHFSYNWQIEQRLNTEYNAVTVNLPFGFDISQELYDLCEKEEEVKKACFLGNPDTQRAAFLEKLADKVPVDVYGNKWSSFTSHSNIQCFQEVRGEEFWKILRKYRVQINLMRIHNEDSHNMRTFEVPAIGGIMLAPRTTEHEFFFKEGREVFFYNNINDCISSIEKIMTLSNEQSKVIRSAAREASLQKGYSYKSRSQYVVKTFHNLLTTL